MAVLTTSGRADYVVLDDDTGRAVWYRNLGREGDWGWGLPEEAATGPRQTIEQNYGWKFHGKNVRFAEYVQVSPRLCQRRFESTNTRSFYVA